jgi:hypothetical protein
MERQGGALYQVPNSNEGEIEMGALPEEEKERRDYWNKIDEQLRKSIAHAEEAYRTNYWINIMIVAIGVILVGFSLSLSIVRGTDPSTLTYAGLGITDFVALFLVNPQKRLLLLLGDYGQIALIYKTWNQQNQMIDNAVWDESQQKYTTQDPAKIREFIGEYAQIGEEALSAIEKYIGTEPTTSTTGTTAPAAPGTLAKLSKPARPTR